MPLYDYDCANCGRRIEVVHGVHAPGPASCANCGDGPLRKAISAPAVHFKGSGWAKQERRAATPGTSIASGDGTAEPVDKSTGGASDDGAGSSSERASTPVAKPTGTGTATKTD